MQIGAAVVTFEVDGRPVPWARAGRKGGQGSFTPKKVKKYQERVASIGAQTLAPRPLLDGPLLVDMTFYWPIPKTFPLWKRRAIARGLVHPATLPDLDNLAKGILDALNKEVWADDSQVVTLGITKVYSAVPRVSVEIYPVVEITNNADWQDYIASE